MLQPFTSPFALASLLVGLAATAQAAPAAGPPPRSIILTGKAGESPLLYLSPDAPTFLLLDAPIIRESVQVEGRARFARVDPSNEGLTLALAVPLGTQERLALRFHYREGSPQSVMFFLTGQPGVVDTVVNVSRPQQMVEACRVELSATRERCEAQAKELEELKARPPAVSPAAVALAGLVDVKGMKVGDFREACRDVMGGFLAAQCRGLGASTWTVVVLEVSNGGELWTTGERIYGRYRRAFLPDGRTVPICVELGNHHAVVGLDKYEGSKPGAAVYLKEANGLAVERWR